jgi:hypothetical protein
MQRLLAHAQTSKSLFCYIRSAGNHLLHHVIVSLDQQGIISVSILPSRQNQQGTYDCKHQRGTARAATQSTSSQWRHLVSARTSPDQR